MQQPIIYQLEIERALQHLKTSHKGLTLHEANVRLKQYGLNRLTAKKIPLWKRLIEPFASYFAVVIIAAALLSVYEKKWFEAIIISIILVVNALIYYIQQISVNRALQALREHDIPTVDVIRDGETVQISADKLVPGDMVHVTEGMKVPADGRLIDVSHLQADEAMLTGESLPIHKHAAALTGTKELYDQKNMLFKGTFVRSGTGILAVSATGDNTELGAINKLATEADEGKTPIEQKIDQLTKHLLIGIASVSVMVFGLAIIRGIHFDEALRFTLSLIVSAVPEGLPVAMTLVLLFSANRMAKQKALVKKLSAMETMGAITLIVTDKTGTITKNKLAIAESYAANAQPAQLWQTVAGSLNGDDQHAADTLDELLLQSTIDKQPSGTKVHDFPFDQQLRISGSVWKHNGTLTLYIKGAPETVMHHCKTTPQDQSALTQFAGNGYRTIGFAQKRISAVPKEFNHTVLGNMTFTGLVALSDQLRSGIAAAVAEARAAGIHVVMLTGDHIATAQSIALATGIAQSPDQIADSSILAKGSPQEILRALDTVQVFGRVLPEHKYALLRSVKGQHITAMTGDGVNDIPALVEADAGLAMGSGADAAKEASDIVLVNSNFTTIINAVRSGRTVLANIRKMVIYLLATSGGEVLTMLTALILGIPLPITAVMVLWVNLVTDGVSVIPLGLSPSESQHMKEPPANPKAPLLSHIQLSRAILLAVVMAATVLLTFKLHLPKGLEYAQTIAFLSLIVIQWAYALNMNFEHHSWVRNITHPNTKLLAAIGGSILLNIVIFCTPLKVYFGLSNLVLYDAILAICCACIVAFSAADFHKLAVSRLHRSI